MVRWLGFVIAISLQLAGCASLAPGDGDADNDGGFDECDGNRGDGFLGSVCREDCDCSSGFLCYTDDYDEQCCAEELNDLDNGVWGIDCDGAQ